MSILATLGLAASTLAAGASGNVVQMNEGNTVVLRGEVNDESVSQLQRDIIGKDQKDLVLYIASPGGSVISGSNLIDFMKGSGKSFTCVVEFAASMAFVITQACDKRTILPSGVAMQHQMSYGLDHKPAKNQTAFIKLLESIESEMNEMQAKRIGVTPEALDKLTEHDWWLTGRQAKASNVVDEVVVGSCTSNLSAKTTVQQVAVFIFTFNVTWSGCPLVSYPVSIEAVGYIPADKKAEAIKELNRITLGREPIKD